MRPATKHWLFFALLLITLAAMAAFAVYQWSRLDGDVPGPAADPPAVQEPVSRLPCPTIDPPAA